MSQLSQRNSSTKILCFVLGVLLMSIACSLDNTIDYSSNNMYRAQTFTAEELKHDLDTLMLYLTELHPNLYHKNSRSEWDRTYKNIASKLNTPMNRAAFFELLLPLFQLEQDGHTFVNYPMSFSDTLNKQGALFFPFKVKFWDQKIYLVENYSNAAIPEYAELISINNIPTDQLRSAMEQVETMDLYPPLEPYMSFFFKHLLYPFYGWDSDFAVEYRFEEDLDHKILPGIPLDSFPRKPFQYFEYRHEAHYDLAVIDINLCEDYDSFIPFCDSVFSEIQKDKIRNLIIDLRGNSGGTTRHGDYLIPYLTAQNFSQYGQVEQKVTPLTNPAIDSSHIVFHEAEEPANPMIQNRFDGNVFVLTDEITFSSAAILAGTIQCYNIGKIIGRETGGTQVMYSSFYDLYLPNSGLFVGISTDKRNIPCGTQRYEGVIPDIPIYYSIEAFKTGRDLELEKVRELIQKK